MRKAKRCYMCGAPLKSGYEREVGMCIKCMEEEMDSIDKDIYDDVVWRYHYEH